MKWTLLSIGFHAAIFGSLVLWSNTPFGREKPRFIRVGMVSGPSRPDVSPGIGAEPSPPAIPEIAPSVKSKAGLIPAAAAAPKRSGSDTTRSGKSGAGSGGGALVMVDGPIGASGYYLEIIRRRVESNWKPPVSTGTLIAGVRFEIRSNGRIESVMIEKSSGRLLFDQAAQRAVLNAGPLPPLPGELGDQLTVHIEFEPVWIQ